MDEGTGLAEALLGLSGFRVLEVTEDGGLSARVADMRRGCMAATRSARLASRSIEAIAILAPCMPSRDRPFPAFTVKGSLGSITRALTAPAPDIGTSRALGNDDRPGSRRPADLRTIPNLAGGDRSTGRPPCRGAQRISRARASHNGPRPFGLQGAPERRLG